MSSINGSHGRFLSDEMKVKCTLIIHKNKIWVSCNLDSLHSNKCNRYEYYVVYTTCINKDFSLYWWWKCYLTYIISDHFNNARKMVRSQGRRFRLVMTENALQLNSLNNYRERFHQLTQTSYSCMTSVRKPQNEKSIKFQALELLGLILK